MEGGYAVSGGSKSPAPLTWNDFLERMRHPSAADFVKSIKSFIITFSNKVPDPDRDTTSVQEFLATTEGAFRNHALWAGCSEAELESAGEGLEKYLMTKLYNRTFASYPEDVKHDKELFEKVSLVQQFICPEHLDIKPTFQNERAWLLAQKELQKINTYKAPRDKLVCILNCCKVINNLLLNASIASPDDPPGADDFLPILIYVTIKANPPQLHSNLLYIQRYRLQSRMMSEAAYFFTNILSVESFISNIDAKSLLMDEEEFRQKMEFAQAQLDKPTNSEGDIDKLKPDIVEQQKDMLKSKGDVSDNVDVLSQDYGLSKENDDKKQGLVRKLSISDLEKKGAIDLIKENQLSSYFQEYPFLYAISGDLTPDDVEHLLNSYKLLVFKYVSLAKGINLSEISVTVPIDQQRSEAADDSAEGNK